MKKLSHAGKKILLSIVNSLLIVAIFTFVTKATGLLPLVAELGVHFVLGVATASILYTSFKEED